ncbi:sensor histidine kinase [Spongiimicrobium salis]|uniref:sensor histidine kinase n=1 Tax=Spongiimicrobium salis TaxID=1667022 RepID=UPI00374C94AD
MNKILLLFFISLFLSCDEMKDDDWSKNTRMKDDNLSVNYKIFTDENEALDKRLKAVNIAFDLMKNNDKGTLFSEILHGKAYIHYSLGQFDSLLFYGKLLERHAKVIGDEFYLGRQYYLNAHYFDNVAKVPDSAFYYYNEAKNQYKNINDSIWVGNSTLRAAQVQHNQGDYFGSKETITESIKYLEALGNAKLTSSAYNTLGTNHRKLLNYKDAFFYHIRAIETTDSEVDRLIYKNNLSTTYIDGKEYQKAIKVLKEILNHQELKEKLEEYARVLDNLAYAKWLSGLNISRKEFLNPLKMRLRIKDYRGQIASYTHLGEYFSNINQGKAIKFLDTVIQISKKQNIPRGELDALKFLMKMQKNNIEIRNQYILLSETLYNRELDVKTQFAKYRYDNEEVQKEVLQLQVDRTNQALILTKERTQKIGYLLGLIIASLVIGFGTYFYNQRTKRLNEKTKYLEQQNKIEKLEAAFETEARLSRKVHDDFSGNIYQAMMLVETKTDTTEALDVLEEVYNQSRDFSREINEVDTGENFEVKLFGMLQSYLLPEAKLYTKGLDKIHWQNVGRLEKMTIHKILLELMINMQKYSEAKRVTFVFTEDETGLRIIYTDNGRGATEAALNVKNGLQITEKRIQDVGGTIIFETEKGNGFKATMEIPK